MDADRVLGVGGHDFVEVGAEGQALAGPAVAAVQSSSTSRPRGRAHPRPRYGRARPASPASSRRPARAEARWRTGRPAPSGGSGCRDSARCRCGRSACRNCSSGLSRRLPPAGAPAVRHTCATVWPIIPSCTPPSPSPGRRRQGWSSAARRSVIALSRLGEAIGWPKLPPRRWLKSVRRGVMGPRPGVFDATMSDMAIIPEIRPVAARPSAIRPVNAGCRGRIGSASGWPGSGRRSAG